MSQISDQRPARPADAELDLETRILRPSSRREFLGGLAAVAGSATWLVACSRGGNVGAVASTPGESLPEPLWRASASDLAAAIARRDVSSVEVLEAHLARIEEVNPTINAITGLLEEEARRAAADADRSVATGAELGPLHGVPVTIKENVDVRGSATTSGVPALREAVASEDAPVVERLRSAGAIPFARTNLPDLGLRVHTDSYLYGRTNNPWNLGRNVGGSSGGEAAAQATGMSPLGIGNDIGGSLRIPAQCCGTASLKPTLGRIPSGGAGMLSDQLMSVNGPMARHVADLDRAFRIIAGAHPRDPWSVPVPIDLPTPSPLSVALLPEPPGGPTHPAIAAAVRRAGEALAAAGYTVEEATPPRLEDARRVWGQMLGTEIAMGLDGISQIMSPDGLRFLRAALPLLEPGGLDVYAAAAAQRHRIAAEMQDFQTRYPLTLAPVLTAQPFEVGFDLEHPDEVLEQMRFEVTLNLLGLPAVCVPVGLDDEGLPVGIEIVGARYREDLCLAAGQALEEAFGVLTPIDPKA